MTDRACVFVSLTPETSLKWEGIFFWGNETMNSERSGEKKTWSHKLFQSIFSIGEGYESLMN